MRRVGSLKIFLLFFIQKTKNYLQTLIKMGNILYTIAAILIIVWAIGYFSYNTGNLIHILLVIAVVVILFKVLQGKKPI